MNKLKKYINEAFIRSSQRRSRWNLLLIPLGIISIAFIWFVLFNVIIQIAQPEITLEALGKPENDFYMIFVVIPLFFASIPLGFIITNLICYLIPSARKAFENEAIGHPGTSFKESTKKLLIIAIIATLITLPISYYAALNLVP